MGFIEFVKNNKWAKINKSIKDGDFLKVYNGKNNLGYIDEKDFDYKEKMELYSEVQPNNKYRIPRHSDLLTGIEIVSQDYKNIKSIELQVGGQTITHIYDFEVIDEFEIIKVDLKKIFLFTGYIQMIALQHHEVWFIVHGEVNNISLYGEYARVSQYRYTLATRKYLQIVNKQYKHEIDLVGSVITMEYRTLMDGCYASNLQINKLRFKFDCDIKSNLGKIKLICVSDLHKNCRTDILPTDLEFINNNEFILKNVSTYYLVQEKIKFEFIFKEKVDANISIISYHCGYFLYCEGMAGCTDPYNTIPVWFESLLKAAKYKKITLELFKRVLEKNDKICAISRDEFEEKETRIICGSCFTSYKEDCIEVWFETKKDCPYCRAKCKWLIKTFDQS